MSSLFIIEDKIVKPTAEALLIYPFRQIWDRDKTEMKEIASKENTFIEFYCSKKKTNPYAGYLDDDVRKKKIIEGVFVDVPDWKPDKLVEDGMMAYDDFQLNASPTLKFYNGALVGLQKLQEYYETLDMTKETKTGMLVNKPSDVANGLVKTAALLTEFTSLREKVEQELLSNTKTRGNRVINHFEK